VHATDYTDSSEKAKQEHPAAPDTIRLRVGLQDEHRGKGTGSDEQEWRVEGGNNTNIALKPKRKKSKYAHSIVQSFSIPMLPLSISTCGGSSPMSYGPM
jgi:hypothetical protein